ncbi:TonB-dependent receptor [Acidovorax sp. 106]|uniref:TonB-dependent receptor n=1 Tax=Acidovorax sp. 106 TaxID=2135637 RepID=UPI000EB28BAA|nr:TonB-dependent receptor [Acidovorax sp. 106]RLJ36464.1 iron complex outermembrane receptor protein [Acidovorax sp. 106]
MKQKKSGRAARPNSGLRMQPLALSLLALLATSAAVVRAQEVAEQVAVEQSLPDVQITAQKVLQDNQSVGASVYVLSGADAKEQGITSTSDLVGRIGNLHNLQGGSTPLLSIRGIGQRLNTPGVGLYVDDVPYLDHFAFPANLQLFDIERMEVLRGPQGTLYGGNTMGGVLNIVTRQPDAQLRGETRFTVGSHGLRQASADLNVPLNQQDLFLGISAATIERDGYTKNTFLGRDADPLDERGLRLRLRYLPSDSLDITLGLDVSRIRDGYYDKALATGRRLEDTVPHRVAYDFPGRDDKDLRGASLRVRYDADRFTLTSITGLRDNKYTFTGEFDGTPQPVANDVYSVKQRQWTQELRLSSRTAENIGLSWLGGVFLFNDRRQGNDRLAMVPMGVDTLTGSMYRTRGTAFFGNVEYWFMPYWGVQAGLRHERETVSYGAESTSFMGSMPVANTPWQGHGRSFSQTAPKVGAMFKPADGTLLYGTVAKGYRSGGFNTVVLSEADRAYGPETNINYEAGLKLVSQDKRLQFNAAVFRSNIDNQQIGQSLGVGTEVTRNAGKSRHQGLEFDAAYLLPGGWRLSGSMSYLDAKFRSYTDVLAGTDYAGNRVPFVPSSIFSAAIQKRHLLSNGLKLVGQVEVSHVGSIYYDAANQLKGQAFSLLNLRVGIEDKRWSASMWVRNATDRKYIRDAGVNPLTLTSQVAFGAPRTLGIDVAVKF